MLLLPRQSSRRVTAPISPLNSCPASSSSCLTSFKISETGESRELARWARDTWAHCYIHIPGHWDEPDVREVFIGARTVTASKSGGQFGVFHPGVQLEPDRIATNSAWIYGLQQNSETRTNLALVCAGLATGDPNTFRIDLFDGATGAKVNTIDGIRLDSQGWIQMGSILDQHAPGTTHGYAHVTRTAGKNPFIAYAVVNDGAQPGERTGDGAFLLMQLDIPVP